MIAEFVLYYGITLLEFHLGIYTCFSGKLKYPWIQALGGAFAIILSPVLRKTAFPVEVAATLTAAGISCICLKQNWKQKFYQAAIVFIFLEGIRELINGPNTLYQPNIIETPILALLGDIVYFLVFCFILTIQHHTSLQMKPKLLKIAKKTLPALALILVWDILLIIGVISLAIEYIPGTGAKILFGALEFISFFSLLILIAFSTYIDQTNQALVELKKQQEEFQKSEQIYYEMLLEKEQNTRKYRHDMQNHLICLNGLAKDGDLDALQSYLKNMSDTFQSLQAGYYETGNKILNIITLHILSQLENSANIHIYGKACNAEIFSQADLGSIYGNLLQNAVEELNRFPKGTPLFLTITFSSEGNALQIELENSCRKREDYVTTSKKEKSMHGYGLKNVQEALDRIGGAYNIQLRESSYYVSVILPVPAAQWKK